MHNSWGAKSWKKIEGLNIIIWKGGGTKLIILVITFFIFIFIYNKIFYHYKDW